MKNWKKYILWFAQEHTDFRQAEFDSLVQLFNLEYRKISLDSLKPFWILEFPNEDSVLKIGSRSVGVRAIFELWSHGQDYKSFHKELKNYIKSNAAATNCWFKRECSFKITVETYNKHLLQKEKVQKIETMDYLPLEGNVDLKSPNVEWWYIEFWGLDPTNVPETPEDILFGRWLGNGQRHLIKEMSLKKRKFIGNTSMDAQLSLIMANQALVQPGDIVFDPFVGTGSLLVSAAKFGGYVLGADIDFMMLHARARPSRITQKVREKDESIRSNLQQYNCETRYLDVVVADFSNPLWRDTIKFDSIITDPPYGIRESTEKVETKYNGKPINKDVPHYPSTSHYSLRHLYKDLLLFAAKHLKNGGRLVCWLPFHKDDYTEKMIPLHKNLRLVSNSEQSLSGQTARRLLTYEKHSEPDKNQDFNVIFDESLNLDFRERYFDNAVESRSERRMRKAEQRVQGRLEALKRGKAVLNGRENKCNLNKARFNHLYNAESK
ncbi:tRNA (guanine(10)-N2)-methyltransferase homolog isoform X1 [Stomoxys calcitrans]|uniref:tRNA (guanine(10)-N2)-methyltransferase homolog isoform X1 n=1 Tax=Stomoxys calcitrans TaxID=35570 RepID=UPI0027E2E3CF|nr:tRNA (guanine(10)-N2)-methyltransferase homolog isoform X1 [Stomoxys calcitrans]